MVRMTHNEMYRSFESFFPEQAKRVVAWHPNGKDSIKIRSCEGKDYIFTYNGGSDWSLKTIEFDRDKGGRGM